MAWVCDNINIFCKSSCNHANCKRVGILWRVFQADCTRIDSTFASSVLNANRGTWYHWPRSRRSQQPPETSPTLPLLLGSASWNLMESLGSLQKTQQKKLGPAARPAWQWSCLPSFGPHTSGEPGQAAFAAFVLRAELAQFVLSVQTVERVFAPCCPPACNRFHVRDT